MHGMQHKKPWLVPVLAVIAILLFLYWLSPTPRATVTGPQPSSIARSPDQQSLPGPAQGGVAEALPFSSHSQQDTQVDCQLQLDAGNRLMVNEHTRNCFEYFITQYGEKSLEQIRADFQGYIQHSYHDPARAQVLDLWSRYMDYRKQLGQLSTPSSQQDDSRYYQKLFNQTQSLRQQYFSAYEIEGLFGTEDQYHAYTLDRMSILQDASLSEAEKAQKLRERFQQLPEDWQANLEQVSQLEDLRKLSADLKARHASAAELRQMRLNLVGADATQRLEQLDQQRENWQQRVDRYLTARDEVLASRLSDSAQTAALQQLRAQHFSQPQEQIRIQTFETVHDRGGDSNFNPSLAN